MKQSVTQELDYGCGVACYAYVTGHSFKRAVELLGQDYSVKHGWRPSDLVVKLGEAGYDYVSRYVRKKNITDFPIGTIVLIERSVDYPVGHYLVRSEHGWMDPWINMPQDNILAHARSGFRKTLPGKAMYALLKISY